MYNSLSRKTKLCCLLCMKADMRAWVNICQCSVWPLKSSCRFCGCIIKWWSCSDVWVCLLQRLQMEKQKWNISLGIQLQNKFSVGHQKVCVRACVAEVMFNRLISWSKPTAAFSAWGFCNMVFSMHKVKGCVMIRKGLISDSRSTGSELVMLTLLVEMIDPTLICWNHHKNVFRKSKPLLLLRCIFCLICEQYHKVRKGNSISMPVFRAYTSFTHV